MTREQYEERIAWLMHWRGMTEAEAQQALAGITIEDHPPARSYELPEGALR